MSHVLAIRHVPFEDLGLLAPLLQKRGLRIEYAEAPVARWSDIDPVAPDLVVVLGGPIGAYEDHLYPFLAHELRLIERRLASGRPLLGICLGSQLIARALGSRVFAGPQKEIGWAPLTLTGVGRESVLRHVADRPVLHWHGDTFDLPAGAEPLAFTELYENQAFRFGASLGLQFHLEAEPAGLESWFVGHALEIAKTPGIDVPQLRADTALHGPGLAAPARAAFAEWLDAVP